MFINFRLILNEILTKLDKNKPRGIIENPKGQANELWNLKKFVEIIKNKKVCIFNKY